VRDASDAYLDELQLEDQTAISILALCFMAALVEAGDA
jgi:hypothetical protein